MGREEQTRFIVNKNRFSLVLLLFHI